MLRTLLYLILTAFVLTLLRGIVGIIGKAFTQATMGESAKGTGPSAQPRSPAGGVLRKDPVCGVYVAESAARKLRHGEETLFFCSDECMKKFTGAKSA